MGTGAMGGEEAGLGQDASSMGSDRPVSIEDLGRFQPNHSRSFLALENAHSSWKIDPRSKTYKYFN